MTWNYRLVKYADGSGFGVHEVHYDSNGNEVSMTDKTVEFVGDTAEEVRSAMTMAKMDVSKRPVFNEPDDWESE